MKTPDLSLFLLGVVACALATRADASPREDNAAVVDAIERELVLDPAVPASQIDVGVDDGVATLTGDVDNLLAKKRAERITQTVKGVRAVVDRLDVHPREPRSDERVADDVRAALLSDPATDSYPVDTDVHDGQVVLTGTVDSWQEKQLCGRVAEGVDGVRGVTNQLSVEYESHRNDDEIRHEVQAALRWDVLVDAALVQVHVDQGKVALKGTVGSAAEKRLAREDAWVSGVTSVDSTGLEVARWARDADLREDASVYRSDGDVRRALEAAMEVDPRVKAFDVNVTAVGGVVTLDGVVDNLAARDAAEQDARDTVGTLAVRDDLKVRPALGRDDVAIAGDVRAALLRDPFVDHSANAVDVSAGTVYLDGNVDSDFQKEHAQDLAERVHGVTKVVDRLDVADESPYAYDPWIEDGYGFPHGEFATRPRYSLRTDWDIRNDIESQLEWSPFVDADEVNVAVEDGVATLTGTVDTWMERGAAEDDAYEGGATLVRNHLEVKPPESAHTAAATPALPKGPSGVR